jgi:hypothetical protein
MAITNLCSVDDVSLLLSSEGLALRIDDDPRAATDAIAEASAFVFAYVGRVLKSVDAAEVPILKFISRFYAARELFYRRGESPPDSWNDKWKEHEAILKKIASGEIVLHETTTHITGPAVSVQAVNLEAFPSLLISTARSTADEPTPINNPETRYRAPR